MCADDDSYDSWILISRSYVAHGDLRPVTHLFVTLRTVDAGSLPLLR